MFFFSNDRDLFCVKFIYNVLFHTVYSHIITEKQMKMETFRKRDVVLVKDLDISVLRRLQTKIGGWSERMKWVT